MKTVIVDCLDGERKQINLDTAKNLGISTQENGGTRITGVWYQPKAKRIIVGVDSIWEDRSRPGCTIGQSYHEAGADEIALLAKRHGNPELVGLVPVLEDA